MGAAVSSPTFKDFIFEAYNAKSDDHFIVEEGCVSIKRHKRSDAEAEINKRAWSAFSRAIKAEFTKSKIDWICNRYKLKFEDFSNGSHPLERRYIEYFGVGRACATRSDLQESLNETLSFEHSSRLEKRWILNFFLKKFNLLPPPPTKNLSSCSEEDLRQIYARATRNKYLGDTTDPRKLSGAPNNAHEIFVHDVLRMDQQRCNLFQGISELRSKNPSIRPFDPYYQRLSMAITSLLDGPDDINAPEFVIPVPGPGEGELDFYQVHNIISGGGLTAVFLKPLAPSSPLKPIISFRCTKQVPGQKDAILSMLNNGEKNIGKSGYDTCKESLLKEIQDDQFTGGQPVTLIGYSLGGNHATRLFRDALEKFPKKIGEFIGFNFVGNDGWVVEDIARFINGYAPDDIPPEITIHRVIGDWVNGSGDKHPGYGIKHPHAQVKVYEWPIDNLPIPPKNAYDPAAYWAVGNLHGFRPMDAIRDDYKPHIYQGRTLCDTVLDTYNRDPVLEDQRQTLGNYMRLTVRFFHELIQFIIRFFNIDAFKKSV